VNSGPDNSRVSLLPYLVPLSYFLILATRSYPSVGRLPADPGYDYVLDGSEQGLSALTLGDPYFHVGARLLALVTSWFPLAYQAVVLSILVHIVWSICAVVIANVITMETRKRWLGYLAGCFLVAAPHASESGLGNVGNVKWPLLAALLVVSGSRSSIQTFPKSVALLAVTTDSLSRSLSSAVFHSSLMSCGFGGLLASSSHWEFCWRGQPVSKSQRLELILQRVVSRQRSLHHGKEWASFGGRDLWVPSQCLLRA
jgi:hypothetical protein